MKFYDQTGKMSLGSRLRHLGELFADDAKKIYALYGNELEPKWFSTFYFLSQQKQSSAAEIANAIGHSHVSAGRILNEMLTANLIRSKPDKKDGRRNLIDLSDHGRKLAQQMQLQYTDVENAISEMESKAFHNLWAALQEWEKLLVSIPFFERVERIKKNRESGVIQIIDYLPKYKSAFRDLNTQWIIQHFRLEKPDIEVLNFPKKYILNQGGKILVALLNDNPVGVCALKPQSKKTFELMKMAVAPAARGRSIGRLLGEAAIKKAQSLGASRIYLESNTSLTAAIQLYYKLGFKKIESSATPNERCNIQMIKEIKK